MQTSHQDMRIKVNQIVGVLAVIVFASCVSIRPGYFEDDQKTAERAVELFHSRLSNERYEEIYNDTAEEFRKTAEKTDLIAVMKRTHEQFGAFERTSRTDAKVTMAVPRQVWLAYKTTYEKGDATEEFLWLVNFEQVKLASYRVSSSPRK